jgi:organic radical activating enzyme
MRCKYCYIGQRGDKFTEKIPELPVSIQTVAKALSTDRLGGQCFINLCGDGETLLPSYIVKLTELLLRDGHYIMIPTNGLLSKRIDEFISLPENLLRQLVFKISFHYLELKRRNKLDEFFANVNKLRAAGASITIVLMAADEYVEHVPDIKSISLDRLGAYPHVAEIHTDVPDFYRLTKRPLDEHFKTWDSFSSNLFAMQKDTWGVKRREFCYGGDWVFNVSLNSGAVSQCFSGKHLLDNIYEDMAEPLHFVCFGVHCPFPHCFCGHGFLQLGVIPGLKTPSWYDTYNRTCRDGSQWIQPDLKKFMTKFSQANPEYSRDKQYFINALVAAEYSDESIFYPKKKLVKIIETTLLSKNIKRIAIYGTKNAKKDWRDAWLGTGKLSDWLIQILKNTSIEVEFIIDDKSLINIQQQNILTKISSYFKYNIKKLLKMNDEPILLNILDRLPQVDVIIVAPYGDYTNISRKLHDLKVLKTIPLTELLD